MERRPGLKSQPPTFLESVIAFLVPPAAREHVLGDLAERYESLGQYLLDAVRTLPSVVGSQIRRTSLFLFWPMIAFGLLIAFGRGADDWWPRAAIPTVTTLLAFMLRDAYRVPDPEHPRRKGLVDIAIVGAAVFVCQRVVALWQPEWLVTTEGWRGGAVALAVLYLLRLQNPTGRVTTIS